LKWAAASSSPASASATVGTFQTTTSTTFTDLATAGPAVTITTGTKALVIVSSFLYSSIAGYNSFAGFAVSGATTIAATDDYALADGTTAGGGVSRATRLTTLTAGSNTFTMKYRQTISGTASFVNREIIVIDLGS
jgi:hypothetical protein